MRHLLSFEYVCKWRFSSRGCYISKKFLGSKSINLTFFYPENKYLDCICAIFRDMVICISCTYETTIFLLFWSNKVEKELKNRTLGDSFCITNVYWLTSDNKRLILYLPSHTLSFYSHFFRFNRDYHRIFVVKEIDPDFPVVT